MKRFIMMISLSLFAHSAMALEIVKLVDIDFKTIKSIGTESHGKVDISSELLSKMKTSEDKIKGLSVNEKQLLNLDLTTNNILDIETQTGKIIDTKSFVDLFGAFPHEIRFNDSSVGGFTSVPSNGLRLPGQNNPILVPRVQIPGANNGTLRSNDIFLGGGGRVVLDEF
ncbi:MAG: hypothetical protein COW00_11435 [Bdellovibrio sp. CG12_big_fil_rev_8_21_14_0_65_39_13]|nr:MAG: hypothetical protein COW78_04885 [Bdellovibrio sp. CG22_combo_CG10-13_8_21_14_all_39_27]PIQ59334.1 MAG: hypothetical protein COW00_11435 [Bdellovibrio sp. CG12_big_fil_rev_8_21_14_0_65_39_13]PIR32755.1 MAG: hypothetical protein COV37_18690 [Bdellovibrio sp. CG11_big_fil_rev_8_21_14_0_20_39_38]